MGKLIQCSSRLAKRPYYFHLTDTRVYSIEEVCYYMNKNIYIMQGEVFDPGFVTWLREELGMEETAEKMENMLRKHADLKDIVVTLCCSCDYYDEAEINQMIRIMEETDHLLDRAKLKIQADNELQCEHFERAVEIYQAALRSDDMLQAAPAEYGPIYHNIGVAFGRLGEYNKAAESFLHAYEKNQQEESLQSYLFALHLAGKDDAWKEAAERLEVQDDQIVRLEAEYNEIRKRCSVSRKVRQVKRLRYLAGSGRLSEYYDKIKRNIKDWKEEYRKEISV